MAEQPSGAVDGMKLRHRPWVWWCTAAVALAVAAAAFTGAVTRSEPRVLVLSQNSTSAKVTARVVSETIVRSRPVTLVIPALDIHTAVGTLGLQPDHQVMVPTSTHVVDWYVHGATPGQVGSAVILGHVDSYVGPGTFFYLKDLKAGDRLTVVLSDGAVTRFSVTKVVQYSKASFPDQLVYGSHGVRSLQLVTCGGAFDHATGHYESNIVVFSRLVSATSPTR